MGERLVRVGALVCFLSACGGGSAPVDAGPDGGGDASSGDAGVVDGGDAGGGTCRTSAECEDATYCNGAATCAPGSAGADARGCVAGAPPCASGMTCDEPSRTCLSDCDLHGDADRDGHA